MSKCQWFVKGQILAQKISVRNDSFYRMNELKCIDKIAEKSKNTRAGPELAPDRPWYGFWFILPNIVNTKMWGPTEIRTRIVGFKVQSDSHYTIRPCSMKTPYNHEIESLWNFAYDIIATEILVCHVITSFNWSSSKIYWIVIEIVTFHTNVISAPWFGNCLGNYGKSKYKWGWWTCRCWWNVWKSFKQN